MDYLPGDCSLNTLNTVYTQQIKPKNVSINSATTTFLYFWNKTANQTQYEYYLYKKSSYPSKFNSSPNIIKKPKVVQPMSSFIKKTPVSHTGSLSLPIPCSPISKKDENWMENWNWEKEIPNMRVIPSLLLDNKIKLPRTTTMDYLQNMTNKNMNNTPVYVPKRKRASNNPYASKPPLQNIHSPYSITFSYTGSHSVG